MSEVNLAAESEAQSRICVIFRGDVLIRYTRAFKCVHLDTYIEEEKLLFYLLEVLHTFNRFGYKQEFHKSCYMTDPHREAKYP